MESSQPVRFLYTLNGIDQEFEVVKAYGRDWLCKVVRGPLPDDEMIFSWETIRFGQVRLSAAQKASGTLTTCG